MIIKKRSQKTGEKERLEPLNNNGESDVAQNLQTETAEEPNTAVLDANTETNIAPEPEIDLFEIENIDFTQRQERRRGSRRRGYRRIDDRNLVSRAQEESENIKKYAFEEGYRLGLDKATTDMEQFRKEFSKFMNAKKDVFEYIAPDILEISVDIAKTVIKRELKTDPQILVDMIMDILKNVSKNEPKISIRIHPQSVQFIKDTIPNITYQYGIESKINIIADPSIEDGGCIFQTNNGIVDASIDTQLEIIKKTLEGIG